MKRNLRVALPLLVMAAFASPLLNMGVAAAATSVVVSTQVPDPAPYNSTAVYSVSWSGGGGTGDYVSLGATGLPVGASFSDSLDGCVAEDSSGNASFTSATVATGTVSPSSNPFSVVVTEYSDSLCTVPTSSSADGSAELDVAAASQSITATVSASSAPFTSTVTVGSTGSLGTGAITLSLDSGANGSTSDSVCSLSGATLSATGPGTCYVYASIAADDNYGAATSPDVTVTFTAASQSITATVSASSAPFTSTVTVGSTGSLGTGAITLSLDSGANGSTSDSVCSLSGATLSATGPGTCYVYASIAADDNYGAATSPDVTVTFTAASQSITATVSASSAPFTSTVTVGSTGSLGTGAITLSLDSGANGSTSDSVCSLSGATLSATGPGTCYVYASIAADDNYGAATSPDVTVTFTAASQSITATVSASSAPFTSTVTVGSTGSLGTGAITLSLDSGANGSTSDSVCSLSGATLSATGPGTCYVYASIAADDNYGAATSPDVTVTFTAASQSITATVSASSAPFTSTVTVGSTGSLGTGAITLSLDSGANGSTSDSVCSLSGATLSATGPGTCYVYASIAADDNYGAATSPDVTVTFTAASQSITATVSASSAPFTSTVTVGSTGSLGTGAITLSLDSGANGSTSDSVCSLSGATLSATGPGTCYVYASIAADDNYGAATSPDVTVTFTAASQSITATVSASSAPFTSTVTVGSTGSLGTGAITLSLDSGANGSTSDSVCSLSGATLSATGPGTCYVYASIAADDNYGAATSPDVTVTFTAASQSITATVSASSAPFTSTVTVGSTGSLGTGAITLSLDSGANGSTSDSVCSLSGATLSATGPGTCYVYASIAADDNYGAATSPDVTVTFTAASQSITATVSASSAPFTSTVTVGSTGSLGTGAITLSLDSGANGSTSDSVCSLSGATLSATGPGTCYVYASIAADDNYGAATSPDVTVTFTAASQSITATVSASSAPFTSTVTVGSTGSLGTGAITLSLDSGANGSTSDSVCSLSGATLSATGPGTCYVYASIAADDNYGAATSA